MEFYHLSLLSPTYRSIQVSTGQPEPNLIDRGKEGMEIENRARDKGGDAGHAG